MRNVSTDIRRLINLRKELTDLFFEKQRLDVTIKKLHEEEREIILEYGNSARVFRVDNIVVKAGGKGDYASLQISEGVEII